MATKTYFAVSDHAPGDALRSIIFPVFPGVTSDVKALADLFPQACDALASAVEDMQADGETLPPSVEDGADASVIPDGLHSPVLLMAPVKVRAKAVRVDVSLDEGLLARMDAVAARTGTSRSALLAGGAHMVIDAEAMTP